MIGRPLRAGFRAASLGGRGPIRATRGDGMPAWWRNATVGQWVTISGTSAKTASPGVDAYCGMALAETNGHVYCVVAAAGGHTDSSDNRVVVCDLMSDAPAWTIRQAQSASVQENVLYYADGKPTSRHTYWSTQYVPQLDRVMLFGVQYGYGGGTPTGEKVDAFDLNTNLWDGVVSDAPGTSGSGYADLIAHGYGTALDPATGDVYITAGYYRVYKWTRSTATQAELQNFNSGEFGAPLCWDAGRGQLVSIGFGNGAGSSTALNAYKIASDGLIRSALSFNSSSAYTQFLADAEIHAGMVYNPAGDVFYWFGNYSGANRVYVITPNSGSTWDIAIMPQGGGTVAPTTNIGGTGVFNRLQYSETLSGLVYAAAGAGQNIHFMRIA